MIDQKEITAKANEFHITPANVARDYVFGWLLCGIYTASPLGETLILKGGNCLRKAYFPTTRFSNDLDFATVSAVDTEHLKGEFQKICDFAQERTGVIFDKERTRVELQGRIDKQRSVYDVRIYFKGFSGIPEKFTISVSLDVTEFDKIYLPVQTRHLIHPYSDVEACRTDVRCVKLEETLAAKLKCLIQRRHVPDLYDLAHAVFINRDIAVDRGEVLATFLKKTIFERSPGVAKELLLGLPLHGLRQAWSRYIICPLQGVVDFDRALTSFQELVNGLFSGYSRDYAANALFPAHLRIPIMEAGEGLKLLRLTYDGIDRVVEPYSLAYKRRKSDGVGQEYFYAYDRTGGRDSGPGIKSLLHGKVQGVEILEETFEPRFPVELSKAGEYPTNAFFLGRPRSGVSAPRVRARRASGWAYIVECSFCSRQFLRRKSGTRLREHKDQYGNDCYGRTGMIIERRFV